MDWCLGAPVLADKSLERSPKPVNSCFKFPVHMYSSGMPHCPHLHICLINTWTVFLSSPVLRLSLDTWEKQELKRRQEKRGQLELKAKLDPSAWDSTVLILLVYYIGILKNEKKAHIRQHFFFKKAALYVHFLLVVITNKYHLSFHLDGRSKSSSRNFETFVLYVSVFVF